MLFKQVLRTFKSRFIQLFAIIIMVLLSSLLYTVVSYSTEGILQSGSELFTESNIEEFSIDTTLQLLPDEISYVNSECGYSDITDLENIYQTDIVCYNNIIDKRLSIIEDDYDITLELREVKQVDDNDKYLFVNDMQIYNKVVYDKGNAPKDNEIAISRYYSENNGYDIGDTITINSIDYTISAYALFSDYTYPTIGKSLFVDNTKQTFAITNKETYEAMDFDKLYIHISGGADETYSTKDYGNLVDKFNEDGNYAFAYNAVGTYELLRSGGVFTDIDKDAGVLSGMALMVVSLAIIVICIIISQIIIKERSQIGVLKALGYKNSEIKKPYLVLLLIIVLPTLLLGYILGYILATPFKNVYMSSYMLSESSLNHELKIFLICILVPVILILSIVYIIITRLLKEEALIMMNPKVYKTNFLVKLFSKIFQGKVVTKFKYMISFQSITKFLVFVLGVSISAFLMLLSFSLTGLIDKTVFQYYESVDYEYQAFCSTDGCVENSNVEYAIYLPDIIYENETINLISINEDTQLHKLFDSNNKNITSKLNDDNVIISAYMEMFYDLKIGDLLYINIKGQEYVFNIAGISNNYTNPDFYISRDTISVFVPSIPENYSNMVFSKSELVDENYDTVIKKDDITNQAETMSKFMDIIILVIVIVSFTLGITILSIIMSLVIEDNLYNLSLLKVVGFSKKEVNNIVLNSYLVYLIIVFIICIPFIYLSLDYYERMITESFGLVMPLDFELYQVAISFVLTVSIYFVSTYFSKRKIDKISLQESLKIYQE